MRPVHYTDSSGVFPPRAAAVASSVNPPEQRPSASAASSHRRSARAEQRGDDVWTRRCCGVMSLNALFGNRRTTAVRFSGIRPWVGHLGTFDANHKADCLRRATLPISYNR